MRQRTITLNGVELSRLMELDYDSKRGGFQSLICNLQKLVDLQTGDLTLTEKQIQSISLYANYDSGGFESHLKAIFARTLGV